ncbi:hypothetical protein BLNAU_1697 [Blattamonas nauphoetae]|uniref:Uncharacterized protein n=1 Tax=Blattamonas nauphoetae TaxID=2049346 RepID=A0ABQ9YHE5_9EUKA|nr:hypothetical protein BLNAU_1697 [Blattamonas nauphoetae]
MPDTPPTPERTSTRQPNPPRNVEIELLERKESIRNELLKQALTKEQLQLSDSPVITKRGQQQIRTVDDQFAWKQSIEKKRQEKLIKKLSPDSLTVSDSVTKISVAKYPFTKFCSTKTCSRSIVKHAEKSVFHTTRICTRAPTICHSPAISKKNNLQTPLQLTDQDKHSSQTQLLPNQQSPALSSNPAAKSTTSLRQEPLSAQVSLSSDFVPDLHNTLDSPSPATSPTLHTPHTPTSSTPVPALSPPQRASSPSFTKERMLFDELESQLSTSRSTARLKSPSSRGIPPLATFKGLRLSQLSFEDRTNLCEMKKDKWRTHERARVKDIPDLPCISLRGLSEHR